MLLSIVNHRKDGWNRFDLLVVFIGAVDLIWNFINSTTVFRFIRVLAIERALRALNLTSVLKNYQGIKLLYVTIIVSMPAFISIFCIIFLIFFVFAYLGVQVCIPSMGKLLIRVMNDLSNVIYNPSSVTSCFRPSGICVLVILLFWLCCCFQAFWNLPLLGALNYRVNFQNFSSALLVLIRIATTDNW